MYFRTIGLLIICSCFFADCAFESPASDQIQEESGPSVDSSSAIDTRIPVRAVPVLIGDFPLQIRTNGAVTADRMIEVKTRASGRVLSLNVREGDYVKEGTVLYTQENEAIRLQIEQEKITLRETEVKVNEFLILSGGEAHDTLSVTSEHLETFRTTSGWYASQARLKKLQYDLAQTLLHAPFSGLISRLQLKAHQEVQQGEVVCTLIDPSSYEVKFSVLERDLPQVSVGQKVKFQPLAKEQSMRPAIIHILDPMVDEHGLVTLKARIKGSKNALFVGMKCEVIIERNLEDQLIIPKEALVLRSNREVVFVADTAGHMAKWKYVSVAHRNADGLAIGEGLEPDDLVIIEGNLNLAHDAAITVLEHE